MSAAFAPILFNGALDQAETWLDQIILRFNSEAEIVKVEMEDLQFQGQALQWLNHFELTPMSASGHNEAMGARRLKLSHTVQVDDKLHTNTLGVILLAPLPKTTKLEMATSESRRTREAIERFWEKLREHMRADRVLVEAVPSRNEPERVSDTPDPKPWKAANAGAHQKLAKAWWAHKGNFQAIAEALDLSEDYVSTEIPKIRKYAIEAVPYKKDLPSD